MSNKRESNISRRAFVFGTALGTMSLALVGCGSSSSSEGEGSAPKEYLEDSQIAELFTTPGDFKGKYVVLTGKVFVEPEQDGDDYCLQVYEDPENYENNFIVYYSGDLDVSSDDYIRVDGMVNGEFTGENMLGGEVTCPLITADSVEVISYIDAVVPTLYEVVPEGASVEQYGITVSVDKVEYAEAETRIYMTETNNSEYGFDLYTYDVKLVQNGMQIEEDSSSMSPYNGDYAELSSSLVSGASSSGVLVFPAMDHTQGFTLYAEGWSENWEIDLDDFVIEIPGYEEGESE